jgi:two-component system cell cycle sensor histidine kinase PleC
MNETGSNGLHDMLGQLTLGGISLDWPLVLAILAILLLLIVVCLQSRQLTWTRRRIEQQSRRLSERSQELRDLLYAASHDLRTPLLAVLGFARELKLLSEDAQKLLVKGPTNGNRDAVRLAEILQTEIPEAADFVDQETRQLDRYLNGLLQLSRASRQTITPEPIDMTVAMDAVSRTRPIAVTVRGGLPGCYGDREAIQRILTELVENSLQHGCREGERCRATFSGEPKPGGMVEYRLQDAGPGIKAEDIPRALAIFGRLAPTDPERQGLGLPTATLLVGLHGGRLWLESPEGQGLCVCFLLPADAVSFAALAP